MSTARKKLDWEEMFDLAIDPEKARRYRESARPEKEDTCSMCGNFCAVKNMNRILDGEIVNIFDEYDEKAKVKKLSGQRNYCIKRNSHKKPTV